jgi:hypothetical protein
VWNKEAAAAELGPQQPTWCGVALTLSRCPSIYATFHDEKIFIFGNEVYSGEGL